MNNKNFENLSSSSSSSSSRSSSSSSSRSSSSSSSRSSSSSSSRSSSSSYSSLRRDMEKIMHLLTSRERKIIELRFGMEDGKPRTLKETGAIFAVTSSVVSKIEKIALRKIRQKLVEMQVEDKVEQREEENKIADLNIDLGIVQVTDRMSELIIKEISQDPQKLNT